MAFASVAPVILFGDNQCIASAIVNLKPALYPVECGISHHASCDLSIPVWWFNRKSNPNIRAKNILARKRPKAPHTIATERSQRCSNQAPFTRVSSSLDKTKHERIWQESFSIEGKDHRTEEQWRAASLPGALHLHCMPRTFQQLLERWGEGVQ